MTSVDKANVLRSYAFFRSRFDGIAKEYEGRVRANRTYVDAFCAQMVMDPRSIHVAVAENMFGDIISDLGAGIVGTLGFAPSGDIGERHAVFQPSHGSAPTIAGRNIANPVATILSAAMMLDWLGVRKSSTVLSRVANDIRLAVNRAMRNPDAHTRDVGGSASTETCTQSITSCLAGPP